MIKNPNNPFKITVNCNEVLDACRKAKFKITGIGGGEIRDGNKNSILKIVWAMMIGHSSKRIGNKSEKDLICWGYGKVETNLKISSLKGKKLNN